MFRYRWRPSLGRIESIFWHKIELWVSFRMPPVWVQSASCSRSYACFIEGWTEHTVQLGDRPHDQLGHTTISAIRRSQPWSSADDWDWSTTQPARPSAELNPSSSADGRAGSTTRSDRPFDGLDRSSPSDGRAGSNKPSSSRPRSSSPPPRDLIKLALVSFQSETPLELYDFKTARTRFLVWSSNLSYKMATVNKTPWTAYIIREIWAFFGINVVSKALSSISRESAQVKKRPKRGQNAANSPLATLYEINPNRNDGLSFIVQEKINVKFGR